MNEWIDELSDLCAADEPAVLVTVAGIRGSAPREIGAKMIVTETETIGTIGGGQLEYQCTRVAVELFDDSQMSLRSFPLGASMGQCCGGVVEILFEPMSSGMPGWLRDLRALHGQRAPAVIATKLTKPPIAPRPTFSTASKALKAARPAPGPRTARPMVTLRPSDWPRPLRADRRCCRTCPR